MEIDGLYMTARIINYPRLETQELISRWGTDIRRRVFYVSVYDGGPTFDYENIIDVYIIV